MDRDRKPATTAFLAAAIQQLDAGLAKIQHCLQQLNEDQIWWRPSLASETQGQTGESPMNSIGNLLLHLDGNLRQWLIAGLGQLPDTRQRQTEFDDRSHRPSSELLVQLAETIAEAQQTMLSADDQSVLQTRKVQEFHINGVQAIWDSISHFKGHVQEIVHITRCQLGDGYQFDFTPADKCE